MTNQTIPAPILSRFTTVFEGFRSAELYNTAEFNNLTLALRRNGASFRTKIIKNKKVGRKFVVMLVTTSGDDPCP